MYRSEKATKVGDQFPFEQVLLTRKIVVDSASVDPLDTDADDKYIIPGSTPMAPVAANNGRYSPLKLATAASATYDGGTGKTSIVVDDVSPFAVGDTVLQWDVSDGYTESTIGDIESITTGTNTLVFNGDVSGDIAANDPVGVDYLDRDVLLLESAVDMRDPNNNAVHRAATGVIAGQTKITNTNMSAGVIGVLEQSMELMDFIPAEPGVGEVTDKGLISAGELAPGVGDYLISFPISDLSNVANADVLAAWKPGHAGAIEAIGFTTGDVPASTADKDIDLAAHIAGTITTGGLLTLLTGGCDAKGERTAGTAITGANVFAADSELTIKCVEATAAFVEGNGSVVVQISKA